MLLRLDATNRQGGDGGQAELLVNEKLSTSISMQERLTGARPAGSTKVWVAPRATS
jgi:hypothetical protein